MKSPDFTKFCTCLTEERQPTGGCPIHGITIKFQYSVTLPKYESEFTKRFCEHSDLTAGRWSALRYTQRRIIL